MNEPVKPDQTNSNAVKLTVLFIGILAVSTASIFIRFAQVEMPSLVIAAGRMVIAALIMLPFALLSWTKMRFVPSSRDLLFLLLAGLFLGLHFASWITSLQYTTVASSVVIVTTAPLWVALFSPLVLKERLTKKVLIGMAVALCGSMLVGISSSCSLSGNRLSCNIGQSFFSGEYAYGNLLAFFGALLSAGYLIIGRKARGVIQLPVYTFIVYSIAAIFLLLLVVLSGARLTGYSTQGYLWLFLLALIPQAIGHTAFNWALKYLPAAYVSISLLGEPVGTIILAAILLNESPTVLELTGGVLILIGITLATRRITSGNQRS